MIIIDDEEYWEISDLSKMWGFQTNHKLSLFMAHSKIDRNIPIPTPDRRIIHNCPVWKKERLGELNEWFNIAKARRKYTKRSV